jgi:ketosteroid isomerase-like protein
MAYEIKIGDFDAIIHDDGSLEVPGYDPEEQAVLAEMGYELGLDYWIVKSWDLVLQALKEEGQLDDFIEALQGKRTQYDYYVGRSLWPFDIDDVKSALVLALQHYMNKEYTDDAVAVASVIKEMPWSLNDMPEITVESHLSEDQFGYPRVVRYETHRLMIDGEEIAQWEHAVERSSYSYKYFDSDLTDLREAGLEIGPEMVEGLTEVLEALGLEDEEPEGPDEDDLYVPRPEDEDSDELFGVMYEEMTYWHPTKGKLEEPEVEVEVVIYARESDASEAAALAQKMIGETGDSVEVSLVRRRTPSEEAEDIEEAKDRAALRRQYRLFNGGATQEVEEPDPIYLEWRPLEENWQDRPEDFEG